MPRKAIMIGTLVDNVIDVPEGWEAPGGMTALDATGALANAAPGDTWDGETLTKPTPAAPPTNQDLADALAFQREVFQAFVLLARDEFNLHALKINAIRSAIAGGHRLPRSRQR